MRAAGGEKSWQESSKVVGVFGRLVGGGKLGGFF